MNATGMVRLGAGYVLSALSLGLVAFYLIAWAVFDAEDWTTVFTSPWGAGAAVIAAVLVVSFWIWMLRDYWRNRREDGVVWGVVLVAGGHVAAVAYFLLVQRQRYSLCAVN